MVATTEWAAELARHPWNTEFEWSTPRGPFRRLTEEQARHFDELGFVVLEDAVAPDTLASLVAEIDEFEARLDEFLRTQPDERIYIAESGAITFTTHLVAQSATIRAFSTSELFTDLCADLVGPDVNMYWDQAVYKKPEKPRRFPWHQDNGYTFVEPQQYLTCWLALTDATLENGCPWIAPGAHRFGTLRHRYEDPLGWECFAEPPQKVAAPVWAGSMVVFSSLTPHMTGPNLTDEVRKAYILQYAHLGSTILRGSPPDTPIDRDGCEVPDRQYPVLRDGKPVVGN